MISIPASDLRRMFKQVTPHMHNPDGYLLVTSTVRLEARDGWLYAVATDRYTIAVARHEIGGTFNQTGHIPGRLVPALTTWLDGLAAGGHTVSIDLPVDEEECGVVLAAKGLGNFTVRYDAAEYGKFPGWRKLLHAALTCEPGPIPLTGFTTSFLARWQHAAKELITWQEAPGKPLVLVDKDGTFAGLHMPVGYHNDPSVTRRTAAGSWIAATVHTATVHGLTYHLDETWLDVHGDPWTYSGKDCPDGMPLMVIEGIEDDPHPLDRLIAQYGPLTAIA
jgi:hypothetical protein